MKKVLIITLYSNNNFGNKLQNYALQKKILENNCEVDTLLINSTRAENFLNTLLMYTKYNILNFKRITEREKKFIEFNKKYIKYSDFTFNFYTKMSKVSKMYDYFVVGSDQVWNCKMTHNYNLFFLDKIEDNKKISYAASFGITNITEKAWKNISNKLAKFKNISVREDKGKEMIENMVGRTDVETLIDPTMLLTTKEWDTISERPKKLKSDKYILNYFLGDLTEERKNEIERIAKENKCEIINILDEKDPLYRIGPSEFLWLEKNAFLICTDSFHSSVFAILYNRPFVVFEREQKKIDNMESRIDTLINKFKLKGRRYNGKCITEENLKHDYSEAYNVLEMERIKSNNFLRAALEIEESENK